MQIYCVLIFALASIGIVLFLFGSNFVSVKSAISVYCFPFNWIHFFKTVSLLDKLNLTDQTNFYIC